MHRSKNVFLLSILLHPRATFVSSDIMKLYIYIIVIIIINSEESSRAPSNFSDKQSKIKLDHIPDPVINHQTLVISKVK